MKIIYNPNAQPFVEVIDCTNLEMSQLNVILTKKGKNVNFLPAYKAGHWDGKFNSVEKGKYISQELWDVTYAEMIKQGVSTKVKTMFDPIIKKNSQFYKFFTNIKHSVYFPLGLYKYVFDEMVKYGFDVELENFEGIIDNTIEMETLLVFLDSLNLHIKGEKQEFQDHQIEAIFNGLKHRYCQQELATSSGKTLISYAIFAYTIVNKDVNKCMMIVPKLSLLTQGFNDFMEYSEFCEIFKPKICIIGGGEKVVDERANIIIGTYQTLTKLSGKLLREFDCIVVDEAHSTKAESVKNILIKCVNSRYRIGISGTLTMDEFFSEWNIITGFLGTIVNRVSSKHIIDIGFATPIKIHMVLMNYTSDHMSSKMMQFRHLNKGGKEIFAVQKEREYTTNNIKRFEFITNMISKVSKNTLVLFKDVKHGHGKRLRDRTRENCSDKEIHYIDGNVKSKNRDYIKSQMELGNNKILFATFQTFATGISIKNIHNIFFVESYKSEILVKQALGRGMRKHKDKDYVTVVDFVDVVSTLSSLEVVKYVTNLDGTKTKSIYRKCNYDLRHANERYKIYKQEGHSVNIIEKNFDDKKSLF